MSSIKYRKKPVVIEAIQFKSLDENKFDVVVFGKNGFKEITFDNDTGNLLIHTLEGTMTASPGDYIIKGVSGELYPCKPEIFELTYEKVE